jgi:LuxR family maltose regulon positive regulatory protein
MKLESGAVSEQEALLATKLYVPRPHPGFVVRPRLVDRLDQGLQRGLILICAPAGSGKTALLADWAGRSRQRVAWLSLDAGDNDPARFWRHAAAALERVRPGISGSVGVLVGPSAPPPFERLVTALVNELALDSGETVLVLDDYHLIEAQPVHAALGFLLEHLPPGMHLVLASRADPPLALPRLRARGQLAELRAADLRFSADEAAALLHEAAGPGLAGAAVDALTARTEGWAAGLQLAALSLRGQADVTGFVETFSGSNRYVLDYLAGEVLDRQTEQVREFLLDTSVLERLSGELCDAVTGRPGGQAMLEAIERANLFLVPLDDVRGWWRYHQLFADLLRVRLVQEQPDRVTALHHAAAAWHEAHGLADDAVRHAVAAGDTTWAARLIEHNFDPVYLTGESATLQRWLAQLPTKLVRSRPRLGLALTFMALLSGDVMAVTAPLEAAEHASAGAAEAFEPSVGRAASLLSNVPAAIAISHAWLAYLHGDAEEMATFAAQARRRLADSEWMLESIYQLNMALANWLRGRLGEAERGFTEGIAGWLAENQRNLAVGGCNFLGQVQRGRGRLDAAAATYRRILDLTAPGGAGQPVAGYGHVGLAEVAYQRNDLAAARAHAAEGTALARRLSETQPLANGLATLAWVRQAEGDAAGALDAISEAERAAPSPAVANLLNPVPALRARLLLAQGDLAAAARWAEERGVGPDDAPTYAREQEYLLLARVLLAQDRAGQALTLLERLLAGAAAQGRTGSVIEIRALQALALAAAGDEDAVISALADALTLGCPQGYVRVFADEGPPMAALLARLVAAQRARKPPARDVPLDCLARVLQAFAGHDAAAGSGRGAAAPGGMVERLTARELEVLQFLAAGASNQRIAGELVVTLDTVKKHVSHIFGKLGATSRTEAVARARQLGVLP